MSIDSLLVLKPLPKQSWGAHCSRCDKPQARWGIAYSTDPIFICGLCVLTSSSWAARNPNLVRSVSEQVEHKGQRKLARDTEGNLTNSAECDDVLGVLVLMELTIRRISSRK